MAKPDPSEPQNVEAHSIEPLYSGLKDAKPSTTTLPVRIALVALFLLFLFWIVWLQAH